MKNEIKLKNIFTQNFLETHKKVNTKIKEQHKKYEELKRKQELNNLEFETVMNELDRQSELILEKKHHRMTPALLGAAL